MLSILFVSVASDMIVNYMKTISIKQLQMVYLA